MQPWIRNKDAHSYHGSGAGYPWAAEADLEVAGCRFEDDGDGAEPLSRGRHGPIEREDLAQAPETIPITLEALTYGRHAAQEDGTPGRRAGDARRASEGSAGSPPGDAARPATWRDRWRLAQGIARRLGARGDR